MPVVCLPEPAFTIGTDDRKPVLGCHIRDILIRFREFEPGIGKQERDVAYRLQHKDEGGEAVFPARVRYGRLPSVIRRDVPDETDCFCLGLLKHLRVRPDHRIPRGWTWDAGRPGILPGSHHLPPGHRGRINCISTGSPDSRNPSFGIKDEHLISRPDRGVY